MTDTETLRHRFTVEDWYRLIEIGFLTREVHVELFDGEIIDMAPMSALHDSCVMRSNHHLFPVTRDAALLSVKCPLRTSDDSVLQPDIVLLELRDDFYASGAPRPAQVLLLLEMAEASLDFDRGLKADHYARTGVREYWVANLVDGTIEVSGDASTRGYQSHVVHERGTRLSPALLPGVTVAVEDLIGPI
jgi:Uma2 family endonuclease